MRLPVFLIIVGVIGIILAIIYLRYGDEIDGFVSEGFSSSILSENEDERRKSMSANCPDRIIRVGELDWVIENARGERLATFRRSSDVTRWITNYIQQNPVCRVPFYETPVEPGKTTYINNPMYNHDDYQVSYIFDEEHELDQLYKLQQPGSVHPDHRLIPSPDLINGSRKRLEEEILTTEWDMTGSKYDALPFPVPISAKDLMTPSEQLIKSTQELSLRLLPSPNPAVERDVKDVENIVNNKLGEDSPYKYRVHRTGINQFEIGEIVPRIDATAFNNESDTTREPIPIGFFGIEMPAWRQLESFLKS